MRLLEALGGSSPALATMGDMEGPSAFHTDAKFAACEVRRGRSERPCRTRVSFLRRAATFRCRVGDPALDRLTRRLGRPASPNRRTRMTSRQQQASPATDAPLRAIERSDGALRRVLFVIGLDPGI